MRTKLCVFVAGLGLLAALTATPVVAHHAFNSEFDAKRPVKFKGTVTKMVWVNPYAWIYIDVKNADGGVEEWMVEAGTPNTLLRRGFTKQSLQVGTEITVDGYQSKDGSLRMNGRDVTLPNGQTLFIGSSGTGAPSDEKPKK
jgi:Family of unknown function (DUF6152)